MIKRINNHYELKREFEEFNRGDYFSNEGFKVLFDLITEYEDAAGEDYELDIIGLCSQFSELTEKELMKDYNLTIEELEESNAIYRTGEKLNNNGKLEKFVILDVESLDVESFYKIIPDC